MIGFAVRKLGCSSYGSGLDVMARFVFVTTFCIVRLTTTGALAAEPKETLHLSFDPTSIQRLVTEEQMLSTVPSAAVIDTDRIVALEDHAYFMYLQGATTLSGQHETTLRGSANCELLRRVFFFRSGLMVIDDQIDARCTSEIVWTLKSPALPQSVDQEVGFAAEGLNFRCRSLLPNAAEWTVRRISKKLWLASHSFRGPPGQTSERIRLLHVMKFSKGSESALPVCSVERHDGTIRLEMLDENAGAEKGRTVRLWIPDGSASGRIEIVGSHGRDIIPNRLLPAGILPPGLDAAKRRLQWDLPYQIEGMAIWDTKQPSSELKRVVESGQLKPCRAVEIGCGTGNDAIYLAEQGFDVTAIDISPTALNIAERKATKQGVKVQWLLADILQPPPLEEFDFVYDRGCYHEVRQHHAKDYVASIRKLTHDASKILILAGNANKDSYWRFHGPPRVREQDIRKDFATGFRILHLSEFRFDPAPPDREGALAWSILLQRKQLDTGAKEQVAQ